MQNHLDEVCDASHVHEHRPCNGFYIFVPGDSKVMYVTQFYAMVSFCNPGVLGTPAHFRRNYEVMGPLCMPSFLEVLHAA